MASRVTKTTSPSLKGGLYQKANQTLARPPWSLLASLAFVSLTTGALLSIQRSLLALEPHRYIRPYIMFYVIPIVFMTRLGGRWLGLFTLVMCLLLSSYFLMPPSGWGVQYRSDWIGLEALLSIGCLIVVIFDLLQKNVQRVMASASTGQENIQLRWQTKVKQIELQASAKAVQTERQVKLLPSLFLPKMPQNTPGLDLRVHYQHYLAPEVSRAIFAESFTTKANTLVVVIGSVDYSGPGDGLNTGDSGSRDDSGLAVAADVALVKNMLRAAFYRGASPGDAVTEFNDLLIRHQLLPRPCELFAASFDAETMTWSSASCGSPVALVKRADTGEMEELAEAGPLLGVSRDAVFPERVFRLSPGDTIVIFHSGAAARPEEPTPPPLVEQAGTPQRQSPEPGQFAALLLWKTILREHPCTEPEQTAQESITELLRSWQEYPVGVQTDSLCLLTAIVKPERVTPERGAGF